MFFFLAHSFFFCYIFFINYRYIPVYVLLFCLFSNSLNFVFNNNDNNSTVNGLNAGVTCNSVV